MIARNTAPRGQRLTILAVVLAAHVLALLLLLQHRFSAPPQVAPVVIGLITVATPPAAAATKPPPLSVPAKLATAADPLPISISPDLPTESAPGTAGVCSTLGDLSAAVLADPVALDAIRRAPPEARSIADAVVIWNAGWAVSTIEPTSPLAPVRGLVEKSLLAHKDQCLDEVMAGPRLMAIPNGDRTMFLVFGSGNWTWRQLVTPDPPDFSAIGSGTTVLPGTARARPSRGVTPIVRGNGTNPRP